MGKHAIFFENWEGNCAPHTCTLCSAGPTKVLYPINGLHEKWSKLWLDWSTYHDKDLQFVKELKFSKKVLLLSSLILTTSQFGLLF